MKHGFAALRFTADENLAGRVYWYLTELPLSLGERVLAPVGAHDRLQAARVERLLSAEEKDAPYDIRLIKRVTAKLGARKLVFGDAELLEFGGVRYDEKHYTPYGKLFWARTVREVPLAAIEKTLSPEAENVYEEIANARGGVLLSGEGGEEIFRALYALLRGEGSPEGVAQGICLRLMERLR